MQARRWLHDLAATARAQTPVRRFVALAAILAAAAFLVWLGVTGLRNAWPALVDDSAPGLELFEWPGTGTPELVQRVNLRRALQGELARSIEALAPVESARVQLALPQAGRPTASIVLQVRASQPLTPAQLHGIRQLVASSVDGLAAADVSVLDSAGSLLAEGSDGVVASGVPGRDLALEAALDRELGARAQSLLERTVGAGRVAVSVRAEVDWSRRDETRESFDPDGQVERSEERTTDAAAAGRGTERVEYEVGKQVTREVSPAGGVKRLSVAVLLDGKPGADPAQHGDFKPWSELELQQLEALAKQAVGFSAERGDTMTLTNAPFREGRESSRFSPELISLVSDGLRYAALLAGLLLLAQLAFRALGDPGMALALPMSAAELEAALLTGGALGSGATGRSSSEDGSPPVVGAASAPAVEPDAGAATLRAWLNED
jgi:flagellar M-ring protein FliF